MASRDFLGAFGGGAGSSEGARQRPGGAGAGDSDDIELSLGLSLGGRFGTEAKRPRLARSSSIASVCSVSSLDGDGDADADPSPAAPLPLLRTSSLPTETEEERWRRREMQSRRRLEARRKRVERRNSMGSSSLPSAPPKPAAEAAAAANGVQLRRSVGSQGSTSVTTTEQGIKYKDMNPNLRLCFVLAALCSIVFSYHGFVANALFLRCFSCSANTGCVLILLLQLDLRY